MMFQKGWNPWPLMIGMAVGLTCHPSLFRAVCLTAGGGLNWNKQKLKEKLDEELHQYGQTVGGAGPR